MTKALVAVSMDDKYNVQTQKMIDNFVQHNPDWDTCWYYDDGLTGILPQQCKVWTPFNRCEIGRWCAMYEALKHYDTVLYCDGDIAWYAPYKASEHTMTLFPHYVTDYAKRLARHWLVKDGVANIGMMEMAKGDESNEIIRFVIDEVLANPNKYMHNDQLWLQNLVSVLPDCGYDIVYNNDAGYNVARWNIKHDRELKKFEGRYIVRTHDGVETPLKSFHFSNKSVASLDRYGEIVKELKYDYLRR